LLNYVRTNGSVDGLVTNGDISQNILPKSFIVFVNDVPILKIVSPANGYLKTIIFSKETLTMPNGSHFDYCTDAGDVERKLGKKIAALEKQVAEIKADTEQWKAVAWQSIALSAKFLGVNIHTSIPGEENKGDTDDAK
jgi:hypothetical protein